ncbi:DNA topoisomerase IB [Salinibacterium sp. dk2585]|uniref:DNA topoisomerase IB n=1 Tax=unclassified Salinibacterium TaxID=2632331 RepID=UPI0011C24E3A|nr:MULTISPECIES: DNA topoisomerase IB [unclassified Salinibacterium]QEE60613.1 DNA topoisomerase IB [Salinibacterium sp. dk2585]TXK55685.1 DNA topoisomerase IB [Salinibacterium sp. dk5596]
MPRLRRSNTASSGITRRRRGKGFSYRDSAGLPIDGATRLRIEQLAIPPAWTEVWICRYPNGHIQATGVDAAGRRQYLYHPQWREQKDRVKFDRALELAGALSPARRQVTMDLRGDGASRERVLAGAFRMLDRGSLRVGSEQYVEANGSHGLSTLLGRHARVASDGVVTLEFPAKGGIEWSSSIQDPDLARLLRVLKRRGGDERLLAWFDGEAWHPLSPEEINADVRRRTGGDFTAKDFRTLHGTIAAAVSLAQSGPQASARARARAIKRAADAAAEVLGNTPTIARKSYIDPRVIDRFERGATIDPERVNSAESQLLELLS